MLNILHSIYYSDLRKPKFINLVTFKYENGKCHHLNMINSLITLLHQSTIKTLFKKFLRFI